MISLKKTFFSKNRLFQTYLIIDIDIDIVIYIGFAVLLWMVVVVCIHGGYVFSFSTPHYVTFILLFY